MIGPQLPEEFVGSPAPAVPLGAPAQPTVAGPTLGDVAAAQAPPEAEDVDTLFQQYLQLTQRVNAPALRQPLPAESRPGLLANVLTFGMAGLAHRDYERGYNAQIAKQNAAVQQKAGEQALGLVREKMRSKNADLGLQMRLLSLQAQLQNNQLLELDRQYRRQFGQTTPPPTEEERAGAGDVGMVWTPDPNIPGRGRWAPRGGGAGTAAGGVPGGRPGGYRLPTAESPLGQALGEEAPAATAPPPAEGAAPPAPGQAPLLTSEELRRRKAEAERQAKEREQAATPLESEDRKVIAGMLRLRTLMKRTLDEFTPEERAKYVGALRNPAMRAKQYFQSDPRFQNWQALVGQMQTQRFELAGAALTKNESAVLEQFLPTGTEAGGAEEFETKAREFYKSGLETVRGRLSAARGRGSLEESIAQEPAELPTTATTPTTTPTAAPTSTTLPRSGTTRGGVAFRFLD
jgi:hypothetical protein